MKKISLTIVFPILLFSFLVLIFDKENSIEAKNSENIEITGQQKLDMKNPQIKEFSHKKLDGPKIVVSFEPKKECTGRCVLRVEVVGAESDCILAISLVPAVDVISAKLMPPPGWRELPGLIVVCRVTSSNETFFICYPSLVFDRNTSLPPDNRAIMGWTVSAYLASTIMAKPIYGGQRVGKSFQLSFSDLPNKPSILGCLADEELFSSSDSLGFIAIPGSSSGVFFYVKQKGLTAWTKKRFSTDLQKREP